MKKISMKSILAALFCVIIHGSATAGFILNGNLEIGAINISQDGEGFYDYTSGSPNTGFEEEDTLVFFLSEFNSSTYLFGLIDSPTSTTVGKLNLDFTDNSLSLGQFSFVDEPNEFTNSLLVANTRSFFFKWGSNYGDGFVYDIGSTVGTDITLDFFRLNGIESFNFLSFDDQGNKLTLLSGNTDDELSLNITYDVPSPASIGLMSVALIFLGLRARTTKR